MEKSRRFPNRTDKIEIPATVNVSINGKSYPTYAKTFTFTASSIPSDWLKEMQYIEEITKFPAFYTPQEKARAEIANLRMKARQMLNKPFSAGEAYKEFGTSKFPMQSTIECKICGNRIEFIVDFFIHTVLDHGNSFSHAETVFQGVLNKLESFL